MASVDSSDIPAGFFSTFSIADPYNPAPGHVIKAQKRNRRVFVCIPCHRRKLKCDKLIPCSRCVAAEIADECTYMPPPSPVSNRSKKGRDQKAASKAIKKTQSTAHPKVKREYSPSLSVSSISSHMSSLTPCPSSPSRSPSPAPPARKTPEKPITKAKQNHLDPDSDAENCGLSDFDFKSNTSTSIKPSNGASHWSSIACEFPEAAPYLFGTDLQWQQRYRQVRNLKGLFPNFDINNNFPFGNPSPVSRDQVIGLLPPSHIVNTLVASYLDSFGATHCLFHPVQLQHEIQRFYDAPSDVSDEWLSQLCMILALGAKSSPDFLFSGSGQSAAEWATIFLNAAQASFGRSSYMAAPSLCTVRILCMMVLAKLIEAPASGGSVKRNGSNDTAGHDYTTSRANGHSPLLSLVAFTVNVAASLELHRSSKAMASVASTPPGIRTEKQNMTDSVEAEMRHRIWVTVQLLDISAALRAGTTTVHKPGESDVEPPQPMPVSDSAYGGSDCSTVYGSTNHVETSVGDEIGFGYLGAIPWNDYGLKATSVANNLEVESDFHGDPDGFYKHKLATFLPLLANIVNTVNSPTKPNPRYAQIKVWDERAHKLLDEVKKALLSTNQATSHGMGTDSGIDWLQQNPEQQLDTNMFDSSTPPPQPRRAIMQYQHLEVLAHRALLALHHESFCQLLSSPSHDEHNTPSQKTSALHTLSQAAVVESSLALLNTHRTWAASVASLADRCPSTCTNMTTSTTATATVASIDSPYLSMLHLPGGGGSMLGLIKPTAAEMVMQPQQLQQLQLPLPLSGRSSPIVLGCGSDMASISTGLPMAATATQPSTMQNMGWLLDLNHDDFGAALLYMVLVLRSVHCRGHAHLLGYPRDETAAVTAVRHSYQVMRDRSYRSVAHFKEFLGVAILFACFRGLRSGNMLSQVVDATNDVEQVVVTGRRYLLWAADSLTTPDEAAALIGFNGPLMAYGGL